MFKWEAWRAEGAVAEFTAQAQAWIDSQGRDYRLVVQPALQAQADALSVSRADLPSEPPSEFDPFRYNRQAVRVGDILVSQSSLSVLAVQVAEGRATPRILPNGDIEMDTETSAALIFGTSATGSEAERLRSSLEAALGTELRPTNPRSPAFRDLQAEAQLANADEVTPAELQASRVLSGRVPRRLALAVKSAGGLLVKDLAKSVGDTGPEDLAAARTALEASDLLSEEIVVLCSRSSAQVTRIPSRGLLPKLAAQGVRCSCGKPLDEERSEEALTVTDLGASLLDKSRWLSVVVLTELLQRGVDRDHILLEHIEGGDEVDCLADAFGRLVLFELKDKPFNLGNAYSFGAKIPIFQPDLPVIMTTEHVGGDAKDHFTRSRQSGRRSVRRTAVDGNEAAEITYIEGIEQLPAALDDLLGGIQRRRAQTLINDVLALTRVNSAAVVDAFCVAFASQTPAAARGSAPAVSRGTAKATPTKRKASPSKAAAASKVNRASPSPAKKGARKRTT